MRNQTIHLIYLPLLAALAFLSIYLLRSNRQAHEYAQQVEIQTQVAAKEMQSQLIEQSRQFVSGYRETSQTAFAEVFKKLILFRQLSDRSVLTLRKELENRSRLMEKLVSHPDLKLIHMQEIINLDNRILEAYSDYSSLQTLHQQSLIKHLEPIAKQTGLKQ